MLVLDLLAVKTEAFELVKQCPEEIWVLQTRLLAFRAPRMGKGYLSSERVMQTSARRIIIDSPRFDTG